MKIAHLLVRARTVGKRREEKSGRGGGIEGKETFMSSLLLLSAVC